jgi:NADH-quinone oxidoreductase subunit N
MINAKDLTLFMPELLLCGTALAVLLLDLFLPRERRPLTAAVAALGCVLLVATALPLWDPERTPTLLFWNSYRLDNFAVFFKVLFGLIGLLTILLSTDFFRRVHAYGEYFSLLLFVLTGMTLLAGAVDLITIYLSFELISLLSYVLAGYLRSDPKSNEAALKYFLYGSAASGVMLYGLSLLYGLGGSTQLSVLGDRLASGEITTLGALAFVMVLAGLGYKIAMVPFQSWAPDVYEGAPTPVTAFLSVGPKAAGFALLIRFLLMVAPSLLPQWQVIIAVLATLTMFVGNLLAIRQTSVKRLLAYSSIAHAGYLLIGVVAAGEGDSWGTGAVLFYLVVYLAMNLGAFGLVLLVEKRTGNDQLQGFSGLAQGSPFAAAVMTIFLLSLTGIPPTAGFMGKLYLFAAVIKAGPWWWLAVVAFINSVISLYYYMNIARLMYFGEPGPGLVQRPLGLSAVIWVGLLLTLALCLMPGPLLEISRTAGTLLAGY